MPDRLAELRRQHALIRSHLEWLEQEIARLDSTAPARQQTAEVVAPPPAPPPRPALPSPPGPLAVQQARAILGRTAEPPPVAEPADGAGDAILAEYRVAPETMRRDLRQGCLLYFVAGLGLLVVGVFGVWYLLRR